jgi:hypothetical protein
VTGGWASGCSTSAEVCHDCAWLPVNAHDATADTRSWRTATSERFAKCGPPMLGEYAVDLVDVGGGPAIGTDTPWNLQTPGGPKRADRDVDSR